MLQQSFTAAALALAGLGGGALPPVACPTTQELYELLNAADRHDLKELARLEGPVCEDLAGRRFTVEAAMNGISTIRVFARAGDWASSRLAYTLDEMTAPD